MGIALIRYKLMPEGAIGDFENLKGSIGEVVKKHEGQINQITEEPIAFGLKAIVVTVSMDESKETAALEEGLRSIEGVSSLDIIDYRRAL